MFHKISKRSLFLLFTDFFWIAFSYALAQELRLDGYFLNQINHPIVYASLFGLPMMFYIFDLYHPHKRFRSIPSVVDILFAIGITGIFLGFFAYVDRTFLMPRITFALSLCFASLFIVGSRIGYDYVFQSRILDRKTLVVGTGPLARQTLAIIKKTQNSGYDVVGFVSEKGIKGDESINNIPILGGMNRLLSLLHMYQVSVVILAMETRDPHSESELLHVLLKQNVTTESALAICERLDEAVAYEHLDEHYLVNLINGVKSKNYIKVKRIFDIIFSVFLLFVFLPASAFITLILLIQSPHKVFFTQSRIGKDGKVFRVIKFRSMKERSDGRMVTTWFGRMIRKFRLDEIPQLINVIKGDMSLVGPRPEIRYFVDRCRQSIKYYDALFCVRPGITGWAQVKFLHVTEMKDYPRKFEYNLFYLKNISFVLDIRIIFKTIRIVLLGKGK